MDIIQTEADRRIHLSVSGPMLGLEESTIRLFETVTTAIVKKPKEIVMDIAKVDIIDSMSIGLFVGFLLKCKEKGIPFRLENMNSTIKSIFDNTQLIMLFPHLY